MAQSKEGPRAADANTSDAAAARPQVTITFAADGCAMGYWQSVTCVVWATQATLPLAREFEKLAALVFEKHPRASSVHLIINNAPLPTSEARSLLDAITARYAERVAAAVTLVEGSGFLASAMRSFITGLQMIDRRRLKIKIVSNLDELATFLVPAHNSATGESIQLEDVRQMLDFMLSHPNVPAR